LIILNHGPKSDPGAQWLKLDALQQTTVVALGCLRRI